MRNQLGRCGSLWAVLTMLCIAGASGCGKSDATLAQITDTSQTVVEPGRGIPKVCEIGMSFSDIKRATGNANTHGLYDRKPWNFKRLAQERFLLVPSLGVIGIPEQNGRLGLLTFYVQPFDSSFTIPSLVITNPFRGNLSSQLSFSNHVVNRQQVEAAFGYVTWDITNYAELLNAPDKTKPFSVRGEELHYPRLGLSFGLKNDTVTFFSVSKPQKLE